MCRKGDFPPYDEVTDGPEQAAPARAGDEAGPADGSPEATGPDERRATPGPALADADIIVDIPIRWERGFNGPPFRRLHFKHIHV